MILISLDMHCIPDPAISISTTSNFRYFQELAFHLGSAARNQWSTERWNAPILFINVSTFLYFVLLLLEQQSINLASKCRLLTVLDPSGQTSALLS